jgi:hypothetical protein
MHLDVAVGLVPDPAALRAQDVYLVAETGQGLRDVVRVNTDAVPDHRRVLLAEEHDPHCTLLPTEFERPGPPPPAAVPLLASASTCRADVVLPSGTVVPIPALANRTPALVRSCVT